MKRLPVLLLIIALTYSCGQYKRFTYIQPSEANSKDTIFIKDYNEYKLQPADILKIDVLSMDKNVTEMFNSEMTKNLSTTSGISNSGFFLIGYSLDSEGNINLPILGKLKVAGLTVTETRNLIQKLAVEYIKDAQIEIRLLSFKIYFLGEFARPGMQTVYSDRANILEAVSMAGDITYNGNRRKLCILRSYEDKTKLIEVDLTRRDILTSPEFFLQPNDVVYVKPLKTTIFRIRLNEYMGIWSILTSTITMIVLINNMK